MTYHKDGRTLKEVAADSPSPTICPVSMFMATRAYSRATATRTPRAQTRALPVSHDRGHAVPCRLHQVSRLRRASTGGSELDIPRRSSASLVRGCGKLAFKASESGNLGTDHR